MKKILLNVLFIHIAFLCNSQNFKNSLNFLNTEVIELGNKLNAVVPLTVGIGFKESNWVSDENLVKYFSTNSESINYVFEQVKGNYKGFFSNLVSEIMLMKRAKLNSGQLTGAGLFIGFTEDQKIFIIAGDFKNGTPVGKINVSIISQNEISYFEWGIQNRITSIYNRSFHQNHSNKYVIDCTDEKRFLYQENDLAVTSHLLSNSNTNKLEDLWGSVSNAGKDEVLTIHNSENFNSIFKIIKSGNGKKLNRVEYNSGSCFFTNLKMNLDANANNIPTTQVAYYEAGGLFTSNYKNLLYNIKYHVPPFSSFEVELNESKEYAKGFLIDKDSNFLATDRKTIVSKFSLENNKFNQAFQKTIAIDYKKWFDENFTIISGNCENGNGKTKSKKSEVFFEGQFKSYKIINGTISFKSENGTTTLSGLFDETSYGLNKAAIIPLLKSGSITIEKGGSKVVNKGTFDNDYKLKGEGEMFEFQNNVEILYLSSIPSYSSWENDKLNGFGIIRNNSKTLKAVIKNSQINYTSIDPEGYVICKNCGKRGKVDGVAGYKFHDDIGCYTCTPNCYSVALASYNLQIKIAKEAAEKYQNELVQCSWCNNKIARKNLIKIPNSIVKCYDSNVTGVSGAFCSNKCLSEFSCKKCKEYKRECAN